MNKEIEIARVRLPLMRNGRVVAASRREVRDLLISGIGLKDQVFRVTKGKKFD